MQMMRGTGYMICSDGSTHMCGAEMLKLCSSTRMGESMNASRWYRSGTKMSRVHMRIALATPALQTTEPAVRAAF